MDGKADMLSRKMTETYAFLGNAVRTAREFGICAALGFVNTSHKIAIGKILNFVGASSKNMRGLELETIISRVQEAVLCSAGKLACLESNFGLPLFARELGEVEAKGLMPFSDVLLNIEKSVSMLPRIAKQFPVLLPYQNEILDALGNVRKSLQTMLRLV